MVNTQKPQDPQKEASAKPVAPEITDFERNQFVQERREWLARYRMLDGEVKNMDQGMKDARLGHTKHTLNIIGGAIRTAFNYRNPMAMIGGIFQIGMSLWDLESDKSKLGRVQTKRDIFAKMAASHVSDYGVPLGNVPDPLSKAGQPLEHLATGFRGTLQAAAKDLGLATPRPRTLG